MKQKQEKLEIEDDLSLLPEQTASFYKELQNAPVICDLKNVNAVGITGEEADRFELLKLIVTDVALRHFAADVKLFSWRKKNMPDGCTCSVFFRERTAYRQIREEL